MHAAMPVDDATLVPEAHEARENGTSQRRRRRASPLVSALRSILPDDREEAITEALRVIEEEELRESLLARMQALSTDELAKMLGARA